MLEHCEQVASFWNAKFKVELEAAVVEIRRQDFTDIRADGAFRLSTGFAAGAALPRAAGLTVAFRDWASTAEPDELLVRANTHDVDQGNELAVAICVTGDIAEDVVNYLQRESLPVEKLLTIAPAGGASQRSIPGEADALGFIYGAFGEIRKAARGRPKLHIFLSCPNGIGVLLGHLWNRVPATQLYDDANSPEDYFATFLLAS